MVEYFNLSILRIIHRTRTKLVGRTGLKSKKKFKILRNDYLMLNSRDLSKLARPFGPAEFS